MELLMAFVIVFSVLGCIIEATTGFPTIRKLWNFISFNVFRCVRPVKYYHQYVIARRTKNWKIQVLNRRNEFIYPEDVPKNQTRSEDSIRFFDSRQDAIWWLDMKLKNNFKKFKSFS